MKSYHWIILLLAAALVGVSVRLGGALNDAKSKSAPESDDYSDALECIMTRSSVRKYSPKEVPDTLIEKILKAGMAAPTAMNKQPWEFVVLNNKSVKDSISADFQWSKMVAEDAFAIVVCGNLDLTIDTDTRKGGWWVLDCSAASENMLLAAHSLGIGGVWCGIYPDEERVDKLAEVLSLPENLVPLCVLSFGYPAAPASPKEKWDPSKVHYNKF